MRLIEAAERSFARHETFHPRYSWFRKAFAHAAADGGVFNREDATVRVGVGKNMVRAIRFWGLAAKLITPDERSSARGRAQEYAPTRRGEALFGEDRWDPYMEDPGTLWLLHWLLLAPKCKLPVWWLAFNEFNAVEFPESGLEAAVSTLLETAPDWTKPHKTSIKKDVSALLRTYAPAESKRRARIDDMLDCPLRELNLLGRSPTTDRFRFTLGPKPTLPSAVAAYAVLDYVALAGVRGSTITFDRLAREPGSPGQVFKLNEPELLEAVKPALENEAALSLAAPTGAVQFTWSQAPAAIATRILDKYYKPAEPMGQVVCAGFEGSQQFDGEQPDGNRILDVAGQPAIEADALAGRRAAAQPPVRSTSDASRPATAEEPTLAGSDMSPPNAGQSTVKLAEGIAVQARFARSASLERDVSKLEPLDGYVVTARALDVVERVAETAATGSAGGAWSLTGPYGSGKSSLALLLDAAFGERSELRRAALQLVGEVAPDAGDMIREAHLQHGTGSRGFHRGLVTADREPLSRTILRALHTAVVRSYGKIPPVSRFNAATMLREALKDAKAKDPRRAGPSPAALVDVARCLAEDAPLLLVVDEFGKNLEAVGDGGDTDPYLLQRLAEAGQGSGLPIFLLTLQHLSFEDYLAEADLAQRREWAKVQGRFEDIAFTESAGQTRALIGTVFDVHDRSLSSQIDRWAASQAGKMQALGISDLADPDTLASCYPLHPLSTLVLPELCSRYGQHERTLFSFLAGPHAATVSTFLAEAELRPGRDMPTLGLDRVYDYFVGNSALHIGSPLVSGRWTEIATRLRDAHGLTPTQTRLAKSVAVLNLVSTTGTVRASRRILALTDSAADAALVELEEAGIITYRGFADEYRIWQGTDADIHSLLETSRHHVSKQPLAEVLTQVDRPKPVVAARHSAENDVLRVFRRRYVSPGEQVKPLGIFSRYDGEVLLVAGSDAQIPTLKNLWAAVKPIVAAIPCDITALDAAARETAAVQAALEDASIADDWVAHRELDERLAQSRVTLEQALADTFGSRSCRWLLLAGKGTQDGADDTSQDGGNEASQDAGDAEPCVLFAGEVVADTTSQGKNGNGSDSTVSGYARGRGGSLGSLPLSDAADLAYPLTPRVGNEMLNRTELTSQGAQARGLLLKAMIEQGAKPGLGMDGYGPEVAMYKAFLDRTGLHRRDTRNRVMIFRRPCDDSPLMSAWQMLREEFKRGTSRRINLQDVHATLLSSPFGMKAGVVPVFVTAALLASSEEVAIYEHGTFKPVLTFELSERMISNPSHFDVKHFANTTGARRQAIDALAEQLKLRPGFRKHRVANVLRVVGHLVTQVNRLDNYTRKTREGLLTPEALKARKVLLQAVEPDKLIFADLPQALGFPAISAAAEEYPEAAAYAVGVEDFMEELAGCSGRLLDKLSRRLLEESAKRSRRAIMGQAKALEGQVLNPEVRAFVLALSNNSVADDRDWAKAVATVVAKKAPAEWSDDDMRHFRRDLQRLFNAFHRLMALHAEHRASGGGPFEAYRVTVTRPDGTEEARLVDVNESHRIDVEDALDQALKKVARITGSPLQARNALLALLGERVLAQAAEHSQTAEHEAARQKFRGRADRVRAAERTPADGDAAVVESPALGRQAGHG